MAEILRDCKSGICMRGSFESTGSQISLLPQRVPRRLPSSRGGGPACSISPAGAGSLEMDHLRWRGARAAHGQGGGHDEHWFITTPDPSKALPDPRG
jgi:hypothetical protein